MTTAPGRVLGLDVGDRRTGVAVSDPDRRFALPLKSVLHDGKGGEFGQIASIIAEDEISELVVGLPLSLSGESGAQAESAKTFALELETRFGLPVHLYDERLSTREASQRMEGERRGGRRRSGRQPEADMDALAASIILQAFLDAGQRGRG